MENLAETSRPLTQLNRKNQEFHWEPDEEAFQSLKDKLCTAPVLAYPDFKQPFILTTDASKRAIAGSFRKSKEG
jgi:hypothetical protein